MVDVQRNFLENITPFGILALGVAVTVTNPSENAIIAVKTFVISRTIHNLLFMFYPHQPFRAMSFVPQIISNLLLVYELFMTRK